MESKFLLTKRSVFNLNESKILVTEEIGPESLQHQYVQY